MHRTWRLSAALAALLLTALPIQRVQADPGISRVLLISIDGFHELDYLNCVKGGYCPNLAALGTTGVSYLDTSTSMPSDSFPGLMALVTGGSPRTMGVSYDVAYDRALNPPLHQTGNGLNGGPCTVGATPSGTSTEYEEGININGGDGTATTGAGPQMFLNGGAPSGDGGVKSIEPNRLERDQNCNPVYPWNFVRVNTVFGVIHDAGGYTAWADKHPAYSSIGGPSGALAPPGKDVNVNDYFGPEINSDSADFTNATTGAFPALIPKGCSPLPDQAAVTAHDDYTQSFQNIQCYDGIKVNAILNEIDGKDHDGVKTRHVPNIFGMNFQAVSIGEKLIYQDGSVPKGYSKSGGYLNPALTEAQGGSGGAIGIPSPSLMQEIMFVDNSIGMMKSELKKQSLDDSTLFIITAKHGQSPVDTPRYKPNGSPNDPASIITACLPDSEVNQIGPTEDDVALLWLDPHGACTVTEAVTTLETMSPLANNIAGIGEIFESPQSIQLYYNNGDSRAPDILITPNIGVTYSNSGKKLAEHGGFSKDDTNVILLVTNPALKAKTVTTPVQTKQVAPTILKALGLNPRSLKAVREESTPVLPGLPF
jgi:hypothetical protein